MLKVLVISGECNLVGDQVFVNGVRVSFACPPLFQLLMVEGSMGGCINAVILSGC